ASAPSPDRAAPAKSPSPASRERVASPQGEPGEGIRPLLVLTLPSLRDEPLPLPRCGRGALKRSSRGRRRWGVRGLRAIQETRPAAVGLYQTAALCALSCRSITPRLSFEGNRGSCCSPGALSYRRRRTLKRKRLHRRDRKRWIF